MQAPTFGKASLVSGECCKPGSRLYTATHDARSLVLRRSRAAILPAHASSVQLWSAPVFESRDVSLPATDGVMRMFEPRYMQMLADLQQAPAAREIVHVLSSAVVARVPELQKDAVGGMPRVGTLMAISSLRDDGEAAKLVSYKSTCRVRLLMLQSDERPYPVAAVEPYDDDVEEALSQPEKEVFTALDEVLRLRAELACGGAPRPVLPAAVSKYAPPDGHALPAGAVSRLRTAGHPVAAQQVATWQRSGQQRRVGGVADPYAHVAEEVGCGRRAEMFSFAAASLLDLGLPERIALLLTRSTLGRLEYVLAALRPHLRELRTRVAMERAVGGKR